LRIDLESQKTLIVVSAVYTFVYVCVCVCVNEICQWKPLEKGKVAPNTQD